jgi:hypothetical protein
MFKVSSNVSASKRAMTYLLSMPAKKRTTGCFSFRELVCDTMAAHLPGAQTERRGGAGPAGGLLGGKDPAGRFVCP